MRKIGSMSSILMIVLMILSCANSTPGVPRADATVMIKNASPITAKNINDQTDSDSSASSDISTYSVCLGRITNKNGKWVISADQTGKRNESFPGSATQFIIRNVEYGEYAVIIDAFGKDGKTKLLNGTGERYLTVDENSSNSVAVNLAEISTKKYTGSASMTFNWSGIAETNETIKSAMADGGLVFILYYYDEGNNTWIEAGKSSATGTSTTMFQFVVDNLPVATDLRLKYALTTKSGIMLNPSLATPKTQIFSDLISIQNGTDNSDIYKITDAEINSADNVYDVTYTSGPDEGSSVTLSWKNQVQDGDVIFDYVTIKYSSPIVAEKTATVQVNGSDTSSFTITDMAMGDEYTVRFQAHHKTGLVSSYYTYPEKVIAKIILEAPKSISAAVDGNAFTISWGDVEGSDSYAIYRSVNGRDFEFLEKVEKSDKNRFSDSALYSYNTYAYKVMGMRGEVEGELSLPTSDLVISDNRVTVKEPEIKDGFDFTPSDSNKMAILPNSDGLCVSISESSAVTEYIWQVNGTEVKTATADNGGTFINMTEGIAGSLGLKEGKNTLELSIKTSSGTFKSEPTEFVYVKVPTTGVNIVSTENRVSTTLKSGEARVIELKASTLPSDSTVKEVVYHSSDESIAKVDEETGIVTLTGGTGKVKISVSPKYFDDVEEIIELDIYKATITTAESLVDIVNGILNTPIKAANQTFTGDWWANDGAFDSYEGKTYNDIANVTVHGSDAPFAWSSSQENGYIEFKSGYSINGFSIVGKISLLALDDGGVNQGYLGNDPLYILGHGEFNDTLNITLPHNQGTATIKYNNVNVIDRGGSYSVIFDCRNGYEGEIEAGKEYSITDSSSITAIL